MADNSNNSKALAKNTLFLYIRMLFSMLVSLYTSRVILQYLGVEDYGIYNVVGGVVTMFSLISGTLASSVSRNITFALGEGDNEKLRTVFSMSVNVQLGMMLIVLLLAETIGVWFLNNKMVISPDRIMAANWVLQFSILTFLLNLFTVPYNAALISHEKMRTFAYIGVLEVILKLVVVYLLAYNPFDKLIYYALLLSLLAFAIQAIYYTYCRRHFSECIYHYCFDKNILNELLGFAGWNFLGSAASVLKNQGLNIMLNLFFGPAVNAARAIATQVNTAINGFVSNFMTALTPQITKAYAQKDFDYLVKCIYKGSKMSYFLLFYLSLPVLIETEGILKLWLVNVPDTTLYFVRYIIILSLADTLSRTSINANNATGDIKDYQIVLGLINLMILPCAYIGLKMGIAAEQTEIISIAFMVFSLYPRLYFVKKHIPITYTAFFQKVLFPVTIVTVLAVTPCCAIHSILPNGIISMIISVFLTLIITAIVIGSTGLTKGERHFLLSNIKSKLHII